MYIYDVINRILINNNAASCYKNNMHHYYMPSKTIKLTLSYHCFNNI